jgi:hypothetical protein
MFIKITSILVMIGILFSYVPVLPHQDDCPEGDHMGSPKVDCGYSFHCPILLNVSVSEPLPLPFLGQLISTPHGLTVKESISGIFHPPKCGSTSLIHRG